MKRITEKPAKLISIEIRVWRGGYQRLFVIPEWELTPAAIEQYKKTYGNAFRFQPIN